VPSVLGPPKAGGFLRPVNPTLDRQRMDEKEQRLVGDLYRRISERAFHERDVLALLILLRPHSAGGSPVRELSDFVAHREKDRGSLKTYVHHVITYGEALVKGTAAQLKIDVVHSAAAFCESLNFTLEKFKLAALASDVTDDILACVMSLLQDVRLFHENKEIGRLSLGRFNKEIWLCGEIVMSPKQVLVVFPALIVPNKYCSSGDPKKLGAFTGLVEARCTKGRLRLYVDGKEAA
jgi:hypothetical protein